MKNEQETGIRTPGLRHGRDSTAGCGSKAEGTADTAAKAQAEAGDAAESGDTVDVEFWYSGGKTAVGVVQEIVDSFNASRVNIM